MASRRTRRAGPRDKQRNRIASLPSVPPSTVTTPTSVAQLFGQGTLLRSEYHTERIYAWFQKRHHATDRFISPDHYYRRNGHEWKVPLGVRYALTVPLLPAQVAQKYPFLVTWRSVSRTKRYTKKMMSLPHAIIFVAEKAQYIDPRATIVSRLGVDIPPSLRNKLPRPWVWCTRCMQPRKFRRVFTSQGDPVTFYTQVKVWHTDKVTRRGEEGHWEYPEKKLALMRCPVCGMTNREHKFRRSNQPWHKTKIRSRRRTSR